MYIIQLYRSTLTKTTTRARISAVAPICETRPSTPAYVLPPIDLASNWLTVAPGEASCSWRAGRSPTTTHRTCQTYSTPPVAPPLPAAGRAHTLVLRLQPEKKSPPTTTSFIDLRAGPWRRRHWPR